MYKCHHVVLWVQWQHESHHLREAESNAANDALQDVSKACSAVGLANVNVTPLQPTILEDHQQRIAGQ